MPTYRVKVRFENTLGIHGVVGEVETGPGSSILGQQFLAVHLDEDTRAALTDLTKDRFGSNGFAHGPVLNIAIHRIYSIEQLDDMPVPEAVLWNRETKPELNDSYTYAQGAPRPVGVLDVWDRNGDRWVHDDGNSLWYCDGEPFPEPWDALLENYGPVTSRFVV